ncbi:MAG: DUF2141 domain-containing protein [Erythrobacter sp.]|jgi:uncharacterized protein (DUF2141 family)|nr:DUF2141 domain-containing protein [Erythrobacter sp.]
MKISTAALFSALACAPAALLLPGAAAPAQAQYGAIIANSMRACSPGNGPAVRVTIRGIKSSTGKIRLQSYHAREEDWLEKNRWINRIKVPARKGSMTFCVPLPKPGAYAIAARHDANDNNETDISADGGAMSNNPSINIFNLGRPGIEKTRFSVGREVKSMSITMLYFG